MTDCPEPPQTDHDLLREIALIVRRVDIGLNNHLNQHRKIAVALISIAGAGILTAILTILFR